jgi:hypothetical protein
MNTVKYKLIGSVQNIVSFLSLVPPDLFSISKETTKDGTVFLTGTQSDFDKYISRTNPGRSNVIFECLTTEIKNTGVSLENPDIDSIPAIKKSKNKKK